MVAPRPPNTMALPIAGMYAAAQPMPPPGTVPATADHTPVATSKIQAPAGRGPESDSPASSRT